MDFPGDYTYPSYDCEYEYQYYPTEQPQERLRVRYQRDENGPQFVQKQAQNLYSADGLSMGLELKVDMNKGFFRDNDTYVCYRRNYTQIQVSIQVQQPCYVGVNEMMEQIHQFRIQVRAETDSGKKINLVQMTPKRDKGPQEAPRQITCMPSNEECSVVFDRIQFKQATANNGKRRAHQQYFIVYVDVFAETTMGATVFLCTANSQPVVVRGRSPGHYKEKKYYEEPMYLQGLNVPV